MGRQPSSCGGIAAVAFGGLYLMNAGGGASDAVAGKSDIPLIQAARGPVKVRPVNPGGRVVPHQNREVYREVETARRDGKPKTRVEDLLAPGRNQGRNQGRLHRPANGWPCRHHPHHRHQGCRNRA